MRKKKINTGKKANKLVVQLAADKKKAALAMCLVAVMAIMWVRVLGNKGPQAAKAKSTTKQDNSNNQAEPQLNISFTELPKVQGRNDVITKDFFASNGWRNFTKKRENITGVKEVSVVSTNGDQDVIAEVAKKLKLDAIVLSENPQAFINNKLLSAGDKLLVKDRNDIYEFEVVKIEENLVFIRCAQAQITLKFMPTIEVSD